MLVFDMSFFSFKSDYEKHGYVFKKTSDMNILLLTSFSLFFLFLFILYPNFCFYYFTAFICL